MTEREQRLNALREAYPIDTALFGTMGPLSVELCMSVMKDSAGKQFRFLDENTYMLLEPHIKAKIYWSEMLFRVYWAAALNLRKHSRWQAGCVTAFQPAANFLSFVANLRGLLESSLDAFYSLTPVPHTLANNRDEIEGALNGTVSGPHPCAELEDRLIHYVYARKLTKQDKVVTPTSHEALEPRDYRKAIASLEARESLTKLYDELCSYFHPTAFSVAWLWQIMEDGLVHLTDGDDDGMIRSICERHATPIELALTMSVNLSLLCLKSLNCFTLSDVWCLPIEHFDLSGLPVWNKIEPLLLPTKTPRT